MGSNDHWLKTADLQRERLAIGKRSSTRIGWYNGDGAIRPILGAQTYHSAISVRLHCGAHFRKFRDGWPEFRLCVMIGNTEAREGSDAAARISRLWSNFGCFSMTREIAEPSQQETLHYDLAEHVAKTMCPALPQISPPPRDSVLLPPLLQPSSSCDACPPLSTLLSRGSKSKISWGKNLRIFSFP